MSLERIQLRKLLRLLFLPPQKQQTALRADIRQDQKKESGSVSDARDFYVPFWSDAKLHISGIADIAASTAARIEANEHRKNLYPALQKGFQAWWGTQRRFLNEPILVKPAPPHGHLSLPQQGVTIKIDNMLPLEIGDHSSRYVYPYFFPNPTLSEEAARIGIWVLGSSLPKCNLSDLSILDTMRGVSFSINDTPLQGNEETRLQLMTKKLVDLRENLKKS